MLKENLLELGLNSTEIRVYLNIVERGRTSPSLISRDTGIKRTTVYAAAEELVQKRLIEEDVIGKTKRYLPRSVSSLKNYTKGLRKELDKKDVLIEKLLPELADLAQTRRYSVPKVRFIGPDDVEDFLYKQALVWMESMINTKETTWWGYQDDEYFKQKMNIDFIDWYWKKCPQQLDLKIFTDVAKGEQKALGKKDYPRRNIKIWRGEPFSAGVWIMGEYVVHVITQNKEQYMVQIQDQVLAESQRVLFKKLWKDAE